MFTAIKPSATTLDVDSQFQVDFLLECIERHEKQLEQTINLKSASKIVASPVTTRSVLSSEELAMLTTLF